MDIKWWGYLHTNGRIQVKRYFDSRDIDDAHESPFCAQMFLPFSAIDRDDAENYIIKKLIDSGYKPC